MTEEVADYRQHPTQPGVDLLNARFVTHRYSRHAHATYTLALIEPGVEEFPVEVAALTGFTDQPHLTRHFKRIVGVPPGAYLLGRTA
jgi:predicted component of type VI protein secretion system